MSMKSFFTDTDLRRIEDAVKQAESKVSGEIVPVFVGRSDGYEYGNLRAGVAFAGLAAMLWLLLYEFAAAWGAHWFYTPEALIVLLLMGFCFGFFLAMYVPLVRMVFVLKNELTEAVAHGAKLAFLDEEVFRTKKRTGILIYISKLEHRVQILGDKGIAEKVSQDEWNHILDTIIKGLKTNQKTDGIVKAIGEAQDLLLKNGFVIEEGDTDELTNNLRVK